MSRKEYFKEPSLAGIVRRTIAEPAYVNDAKDFVDKILDLEDYQYLVIAGDLVAGKPRKFLSHGNFVMLRTPTSIDEAVEEHMAPDALREEAFNHVGSMYNAGFSFKPFVNFQDDKRERNVRLVEICEGFKILCYGEQTGFGIDIIKAYKESKRVSKEGAIVHVTVPSRTEKRRRYDFTLRSIVVDGNNPNKYAVVSGFASDLSMPAKTWSFKYNYYDDKEDSNTFNIFAHEIAAYFKFMREELHTNGNATPFQMSPFPVPTNLTIEYYKRLVSRVFVYDSDVKARRKFRKLNRAEQEVMLWALVMRHKYDATFRRRLKVDGPIETLDWKLVKAA